MTTRVMTQKQVDRVCTALVLMAVTLNQLGFPWPDEAQADIKAAFEAIGEDLPFDFVQRSQDEPVQPALNS